MITPLRPVQLIVPAALSPLAWKLAVTQVQVGSANNDRSFVANRFDITVFNYLRSNSPLRS